MAVDTIAFKEILEHSEDMYEATLVIAKRARQIIADRAAESELREEEEEEPGLLEEQPELIEDYQEREKATTVAIREFLDGEVEWAYSPQADAEEKEDSD